VIILLSLKRKFVPDKTTRKSRTYSLIPLYVSDLYGCCHRENKERLDNSNMNISTDKTSVSKILTTTIVLHRHELLIIWQKRLLKRILSFPMFNPGYVVAISPANYCNMYNSIEPTVLN